MVLSIYPILLFAVTFCGARFSGKGKRAPAFLCLEQTKLIRASACIGVILHHLAQQVTDYGYVYKGPVTIFSDCGILFTGLFFFFSGYGLITNVYHRPGYLQGFLQNRLPAVLIPFWTINLLGILLQRFIYGRTLSPGPMLSDLFGITLINGNGWFIIEITVLYLIFWFLFFTIPKKDAALAGLILAAGMLIAFGFSRGHDMAGGKYHWFRGEWWFNSTITFVFGALTARFKNRIFACFDRFYPAALGITAALTAAAFRASVFTVRHYGYYQANTSMYHRRGELITLFSQMAACLTFTLLVLLLNMRITLNNRVLKYIGGISLELFLIHGYFVHDIFRHVRMRDSLRFALVLLCSLAAASVVSPPVQWLTRRIKELLSPLRIVNDTLEHAIAERKKAQRRKVFRIILTAGGILGVSALLLVTVGGKVLLERQFREECVALRRAGVGETVYWGRFETDLKRIGKERLSWTVIRREEEDVFLLCMKGIAGSSYNRKHEAVSWEESDLRTLLNSETFTDMFSRDEAECVIDVDQDRITLLTPGEAEEFFSSDKDRELDITPAARLNGTNINQMSKASNWDMKGYRSSWWWLRGERGKKDVFAPVVTVDGAVSCSDKEVNRPDGAIRPVIRVRVPQA